MLELCFGPDRLFLGHGFDETHPLTAPYFPQERAVGWRPDELFTNDVLAIIMKNRGVYSVYHAWSARAPLLRGITILLAHGGRENGEWRFGADAPLDTRLQTWVNTLDGKVRLLILCCCNARNHDAITTQHSLALYTRSALRATSMVNRRSKQQLFVPGWGCFVGGDERLSAIAAEIRKGNPPPRPRLKLRV